MGSESLFQNIKVFNIWVFPKIGGPQNGLFIMENPIKMDDLDLSKPSISELSDPETVNCPWFHQPGFENTHVFQGHRIHGLGDWLSGGWFFMCRFGRWEIWRIRLLLIFCMGYTFLLDLHRLEIPHVGTWFIYRIQMVHSPARAMFGSFGSWLWDLEQVLPVLQSSFLFKKFWVAKLGIQDDLWSQQAMKMVVIWGNQPENDLPILHLRMFVSWNVDPDSNKNQQSSS